MPTHVPPPARTYKGMEEFWTHSFSLMGRFAAPLIATGFAANAVVSALSWAVFGFPQEFDESQTEALLGPTLAIGVAGYVVTIGAAVFLTHFIAARMSSPSAPLESSLRATAGRAPAALVWSLVTTLAVIVGLVFLVVPGVYVALRLFLVLPAAVLNPAVNPLAESWRLTRSSLVRPLICWLVIIAASLVIGVLTAIPSLLGTLVGGVFSEIVLFGSGWVTYALTLGLTAAPALLLYGWELAEDKPDESPSQSPAFDA